MHLFGVFLLVALTGQWSVCGQNIVVETTYGPVQGHELEVFNGEFSERVAIFYAIPYGASTAGDARFTRSVPPEPWTDVFVADTFGEACPQTSGGWVTITHPDFDNYGENCLNLNLYVLADKTQGPLPVLLWFHGGAYVDGVNIQYTGHFLATYGLAVVVPNYRLGNIGFAYTADDAAPGNAGMWDQVLALEFVRDNIAAFGGDPTRVTASGQSAGASSTSLHMMSPHSQGLFQQAILESGTEQSFWTCNWPAQKPETYTQQVAEEVGCPSDDTTAMIDCMRTVPWEDIVNASFTCTPGHFCQGMAPVVDGPGGFLPEDPLTIRENGGSMDIPILSGINLDDGSLYTLFMIPSSILGGFSRERFLRYIDEVIVGFWAPLMTEKQDNDTNAALNFNYSPWPYLDNRYQNREQMNKLITDIAFGMPWDTQARWQQETSDVYTFVFGFRGRESVNFAPEWMGVPHSGEVPYVWGWPLLQLNPDVRVDSGIYEDFVNWTAEDIDYTVFWNKMYQNYIKTGNPTPTPVSAPNELGDITWPTYTVDDMNVFYLTNVTAEIVKEYRSSDYAFWNYYLTYILEGLPIPITPIVYPDPSPEFNISFPGLPFEIEQSNPFVMEPAPETEDVFFEMASSYVADALRFSIDYLLYGDRDEE